MSSLDDMTQFCRACEYGEKYGPHTCVLAGMTTDTPNPPEPGPAPLPEQLASAAWQEMNMEEIAKNLPAPLSVESDVLDTALCWLVVTLDGDPKCQGVVVKIRAHLAAIQEDQAWLAARVQMQLDKIAALSRERDALRERIEYFRQMNLPLGSIELATLHREQKDRAHTAGFVEGLEWAIRPRVKEPGTERWLALVQAELTRRRASLLSDKTSLGKEGRP